MNDPKLAGVFLMGLLVGVAISNRIMEAKNVEDVKHSIQNVFKLFEKT